MIPLFLQDESPMNDSYRWIRSHQDGKLVIVEPQGGSTSRGLVACNLVSHLFGSYRVAENTLPNSFTQRSR
jgi:hypothetical protein